MTTRIGPERVTIEDAVDCLKIERVSKRQKVIGEIEDSLRAWNDAEQDLKASPNIAPSRRSLQELAKKARKLAELFRAKRAIYDSGSATHAPAEILKPNESAIALGEVIERRANQLDQIASDLESRAHAWPSNVDKLSIYENRYGKPTQQIADKAVLWFAEYRGKKSLSGTKDGPLHVFSEFCTSFILEKRRKRPRD